MTRNQRNNDGDASCSRKRPKIFARWSDLNHDLLVIGMMKLGFGDYYSFRGVCKSWRSFAHENQKKFIRSRPPMSIISICCCRGHEKTCYFEDFEGRRFKTILPPSPVATCIGLTCGYLVFPVMKTRSFWLVNPITSKEIHFLDFPFDYRPNLFNKPILVFSPSISEMVFVVLYNGKIWFSIEGRGAWEWVYPRFKVIHDLYAFKGKLYALNNYNQLYEVGLHPLPKLTLLRIKGCAYRRREFVRSAEKLYVIPLYSKDLNSLYEIDLGEMKWVVKCEKTLLGEYAFFRSDLEDAFVAVKQGSWVDPRSRSYDGDRAKNVFAAKMWYFPHQCMDVDCIDD